MPFTVFAALGNYGRQYVTTRHNVGWFIIDIMADKYKVKWTEESRFPVSLAQATLGNHSFYLIKPQTLMNESGEPIAKFLRYHKIPLSELVVIHDDIAFAPGQMRLTFGGSEGGHNGVGSCIEHLGSEFVRARIGIGPKTNPKQDLADHVLGKLPEADLYKIYDGSHDFLKGIELLITQGLPAAQNFIHHKKLPS